MRPTGGDVDAFVATVTPSKRRRDAATMIAMMREISGREPVLWGTIIGFGTAHYRYPTGTEGDSGIIGFAPRKSATTIYFLDGLEPHGEKLGALGAHASGVGCLYLKDLEDVDLDVLREMIATSYRRVTTGEMEYAQITITS